MLGAHARDSHWRDLSARVMLREIGNSMTLVVPDALEHIPALAQRWRTGELSASAFVALTFLHWQTAIHGGRLALRRSRCDPLPATDGWILHARRLAGEELQCFMLDVLSRYDFREVRRRAVDALLAWLRGEWPLVLLERVPCAQDVLRMQAAGTRPVTVITELACMREPVMDRPNAFAFLLHDLEHAYQFFHEPVQHGAQRRFAQRLLEACDAGQFRAHRRDAVFAAKFDYLAADMNTHVVHSLHYLRAILVEFYLRRDGRAPSDALPDDARREMRALWRSLGRQWDFGDEALCALDALSGGRLEPREATVLAAAVRA
jgi:hypothetical protein